MAAHALLIEIDLLDSRWHGIGDWPPAPFRLFQALVAGAYGGRWAAEDATAKDTVFRWLEHLDAPVIAAPAHTNGRTFTVSVPNNDRDYAMFDLEKLRNIRALKNVRPRLLEGAELTLRYAWLFDDGLDQAQGLCALSERLHTFGWGIDAAFARAAIVTPEAAEALMQASGGKIARPRLGSGAPSAPCPTAGSLDSLKARHTATVSRFETHALDSKRKVLFRQASKAIWRPVNYDSQPTWLFYTIRRTGTAALHAFSQTEALTLTEAIRNRVAARLAARMPDLAPLIERFLIGRGGVSDRRVRVLPLPTVGHPHASPAIRRVAVEIPPDCPLRPGDIAWALAGIVLSDTIQVETGEITDQVMLAPSEQDGVTGGYDFGTSARRWYSVTPVVLPIPPGSVRSGAKRAAEESKSAAGLAAAIRHAGVDARSLEVRLQREPFHPRGERSDAFAAGRFAGRLRHVEVLFDRPVDGPLVLGDGRFLGLGLMRPVREAAPGLHVFAIDTATAVPADQGESVLRALRRAVMTLAQRELGSEPLPTLFHGHDADGRPVRSGRHEHLFYAAWCSTGSGWLDRLAVIAPVLADRTARWSEKELDLLARALMPLRELRAGRSGLLCLTPAAAAVSIFGRSASWTSMTPYRPTRHPTRAQDAVSAVVDDVLAECARRGLPRPDVDGVSLDVGPHGGISATLGLKFAVPIAGPVLLGRASHFGMGLFQSGQAPRL